MKIGRLTISDRASAGVYADLSGPEIERLLRATLAPAPAAANPAAPDNNAAADNNANAAAPASFLAAIVPDEADAIAGQLRAFADRDGCALVVTTGGTGIGPRDVTPEATRAVLDKELPGFGELMRIQSFATIRTAILSRATAGVRGRTLIVNLPGKPSAVAECLEILGPALREGLAHLQGDDPHASRPRPAST